VVDGDPISAFRAFTAIGRWWPLEARSVLGPDSTLAFVDGRLTERSPDGGTAVWGTVARWVPGEILTMSWHPGREPERAGRLNVTFRAVAATTLVTLEHSGWAGYNDPVGARHDYNQGWPRTLGLFRTVAGTRSVGGGTRSGRDRALEWEPRDARGCAASD
jgi:hypothetical protein